MTDTPTLDLEELKRLDASVRGVHWRHDPNIERLLDAVSPLIAEVERLRAAAKVTAVLGPDHPTCKHKHYSFQKHGRHCTCGTMMVDFGD